MKSKKKIESKDNKQSKNMNPYFRDSFFSKRKKELDVDELVERLKGGDRSALSSAITLIESKHSKHKNDARNVIERCLPFANQSLRIGITGIPGVGKSTFIEKFGLNVLSKGHKIAVLTIDPTSQMSGGSILGDKTRMMELAKEEEVFIRPTPAGDSLGGVAQKTRETILLCEAAGFDTVIVETVGVGQSETMVHSMVDVFLLLLLPGAGDELQGMKRGIMEMADIIAVNKADGNQIDTANATAIEYQNAIHLFPAKPSGVVVKTLKCSAMTGDGVDDVWQEIQDSIVKMKRSGYFEANRKQQAVYWLDQTIRENVIEAFFENEEIRKAYEQIKKAVLAGQKSPFTAAEEILAFTKK